MEENYGVKDGSIENWPDNYPPKNPFLRVFRHGC